MIADPPFQCYSACGQTKNEFGNANMRLLFFVMIAGGLVSACSPGDQSQGTVGPMSTKERVTAPSSPTAIQCEAGKTAACTQLAKAYMVGNGVEKNPELAVQLFQRACRAGDEHGCVGLGIAFKDGIGVDRDPQRALSLLQQACDAGDGMGCLLLGYTYGEGIGVDEDPARASAAFRKACDSGKVVGCP